MSTSKEIDQEWLRQYYKSLQEQRESHSPQNPFLKGLYGVYRKTKFATFLSETNFPGISKRYPDLVTQPPSYTYRFTTDGERISFGDFMKGGTTVPWEDLVSRQRVAVFPAQEHVTLSPSDYEPYPGHTALRELTESRFSENASQPDFTKCFLTKDKETMVNIFLAIKLLQQTVAANSDEKKEAIRTYAWNEAFVDPELLKEGFLYLFSLGIRQEMQQYGEELGVFTEANLSETYAELSDWLVACSCQMVSNKTDNLSIFPYYYDDEHAMAFTPPLEFIPHLLLNHLNFLLELPVIVPDGMELDKGNLILQTQALVGDLKEGTGGGFYEHVLLDHFKRDIFDHKVHRLPKEEDFTTLFPLISEGLQTQVRTMAPIVQEIIHDIQQVFLFFDKNPGVLNKKRMNKNSLSNIAEYREIQDLIVQSGGKGPSHLQIGFAHRARMGKI